MPIPAEIAAHALFQSDRTCCVCRQRSKPVQIHHVDGNHDHHDLENLAVLCLECHMETQLQGGFFRKLDAIQVTLYRDEWVARHGRNGARPSTPEVYAISQESRDHVANMLLERRQYELLARHYHRLGSTELRDHYIDLALSQPEARTESEVHLRSLQGRLAEVDPMKIELLIVTTRRENGAMSLMRLFLMLGRPFEAFQLFCETVSDLLQTKRYYLAARLLARMRTEEFEKALLQAAYRDFRAKGNLWGQVRCLQYLGWEAELRQLLLDHRATIERGSHALLRFELYKRLHDQEKLNQEYVKLYDGVAREYRDPCHPMKLH